MNARKDTVFLFSLSRPVKDGKPYISFDDILNVIKKITKGTRVVDIVYDFHMGNPDINNGFESSHDVWVQISSDRLDPVVQDVMVNIREKYSLEDLPVFLYVDASLRITASIMEFSRMHKGEKFEGPIPMA